MTKAATRTKKKELLATTPKQDKHQQPQQTEKQYQQPQPTEQEKQLQQIGTKTLQRDTHQ
jgi:hypothetical protein